MHGCAECTLHAAVHGHAARTHNMETWTRSMDTGIQHGHGNAAWTRICSMDTHMQHGHRHTKGRWTSIDIDMDIDTEISEFLEI